jgi:hypothetical protein
MSRSFSLITDAFLKLLMGTKRLCRTNGWMDRQTDRQTDEHCVWQNQSKQKKNIWARTEDVITKSTPVTLTFDHCTPKSIDSLGSALIHTKFGKIRASTTEVISFACQMSHDWCPTLSHLDHKLCRGEKQSYRVIHACIKKASPQKKCWQKFKSPLITSLNTVNQL